MGTTSAKKIKFLCIIAAPEGIEKMQKEHPDVEIYCGHIDDHLNVCEGFQSSSDDKTLDTILYIIIAVILIYALYKCCCCPKRNFKPNMEGGYDEEMVDEWDD